MHRCSASVRVGGLSVTGQLRRQGASGAGEVKAPARWGESYSGPAHATARSSLQGDEVRNPDAVITCPLDQGSENCQRPQFRPENPLTNPAESRMPLFPIAMGRAWIQAVSTTSGGFTVVSNSSENRTRDPANSFWHARAIAIIPAPPLNR